MRAGRLLIGDATDMLQTLAEESVHLAVTSPPYWGLRDYGVDGQLGLEPSPNAWVEAMVGVFRELRRVLRSDGTLFLNVGDRYCTRANGSAPGATSLTSTGNHVAYRAAHSRRSEMSPSKLGIKHKDLFGLPWMLAFALRADGWFLRSEIIWHKPNAMPESVKDRPGKAHEHVFLLSKSPNYYYDAHAIKVPVTGTARPRGHGVNPKSAQEAAGSRQNSSFSGSVRGLVGSRNRRTVWSIPTQPYDGAHFACFPPGLVRPVILAGTSPKVCGTCGAPWRRIVERTVGSNNESEAAADANNNRMLGVAYKGGTKNSTLRGEVEERTVGWEPTCDHRDDSGVAVVLDPFMGSGTTAQVAQELGRDWVGIELNPEYAPLIRARTRQQGLAL